MAILTGGTVFTDELDVKLEKVTIDMLGQAGSVTVTKEDTIFLNGNGDKDSLTARCEQLRGLIADPSTREDDKAKLQERLAKLSGGVAVIKVEGSSEVEVGEKKDRYDDALNATRATVEEGILPGAGIALLKASLSLQALEDAAPNFDQKLGIAIVCSALRLPAKTIVDNTGAEGSVIVGQLLERYAAEDKFEWGYDAAKGEFGNMVEKGIVDPYKVVKTALMDARCVPSTCAMSDSDASGRTFVLPLS
jgi:chaperonin GroEL